MSIICSQIKIIKFSKFLFNNVLLKKNLNADIDKSDQLFDFSISIIVLFSGPFSEAASIFLYKYVISM